MLLFYASLHIESAYSALWPTKHSPVSITVKEPFIAVHSGPASIYPVIDSIEQKSRITLLKRKNTWIKIKTENSHTGWVHQDDMVTTLEENGLSSIQLDHKQSDYLHHQWEAGLSGGQYDKGDSLNASLGFHFTAYTGAEVIVSQIFTQAATSYLLRGKVMMSPFPHHRFSPFFAIGTGILKTDPKTATLSNQDSSSTAFVSAGIRNHLGENIIIQLEFLKNTLFTRDNDSREIDEWRAGVNFFF